MARRRDKPDPWRSASALDAIRVALALRNERLGERREGIESTSSLLDRLGFDSVAEMEWWSSQVRDAIPGERIGARYSEGSQHG